MAVNLWTSKERVSGFYQDAEAQSTLNIFQSLLDGELAPKDAAQSIADIYNPIIQTKSDDQRIGALWNILCDAVRALGGSHELSERLVELLLSIRELPAVVDQQGNPVKHEWAGRYWMDLPQWALTFREYGIYVEADEGLQEDAWLAQATPFLNATLFAATVLSRVPDMKDISFYAEICLSEALEGPYDSPSPEARATMYVAPAATWIVLAGERIHQLCKDNFKRVDNISSGIGLRWDGTGFSMERWAFWKQRFYEIAIDLGLEGKTRENTERAVAQMKRIELVCN